MARRTVTCKHWIAFCGHGKNNVHIEVVRVARASQANHHCSIPNTTMAQSGDGWDQSDSSTEYGGAELQQNTALPKPN